MKTLSGKAPDVHDQGSVAAGSSLNLFLVAMAALTVFPFYWMFVLATHTRTTIFNAPPLWFGDALERNYIVLIATLPFWRNIWNSVYVAGVATLTTLFFCSLGGFGFAIYEFMCEFKYKNPLFSVLITSLMLPQLLNINHPLLPYYSGARLTRYTPRPVGAANGEAFGTFLMRQYIASRQVIEGLTSGSVKG